MAELHDSCRPKTKETVAELRISPGTHRIRQAEALGVEAAHDGPVSLRDAGPQRRRVDAHWCEAAQQQAANSKIQMGSAMPTYTVWQAVSRTCHNLHAYIA